MHDPVDSPIVLVPIYYPGELRQSGPISGEH